MRLVGIRIADALHDREPPIVKQVGRVAHRGIETDRVAKPPHTVFGHGELGSHAIVGLVGIGDDHVEPIVTAGELNHDENPVVGQRTRTAGRLREKAGHRRSQ